MPRIVPIQLLKCLKVLLNANGGILSLGEVTRISCLMSKYSKKLVSKCIYVQILKCTDTELLDEFMRVGGWHLVSGWLFDGIRLSNWPLVQEVIELLLLCPVDVNRLKINAAPKTVKGLSMNGGTEAVRILAQRLVDQWLKVVTEGNEANQQVQSTSVSSTTKATENAEEGEPIAEQPPPPTVDVKHEKIVKYEPEDDPLNVPDNTTLATGNLTPTTAQKNARESGLVYKFVVKDGQQLLTKIDNVQNKENVDAVGAVDAVDADANANDNEEESLDAAETLIEEDVEMVEEDSTSLDKPPEDKDSSESSTETEKKSKRKSSISSDTKVRSTESKDEPERKSKDLKTKESKSDKEKDRKSSSSSSHRSSSSSHKSSSKNSSSSSSKSKSSSSSSSSSHRSSSDKNRSDKERSSGSSKDKDKEKEKDRSGSSSTSSSSKHKSSSSSSSTKSSSSGSKERRRDKDKEKSSSSSTSSSRKDKEREKELQVEKDKDMLSKMITPSIDKLGRIPKKPRDDKEDVNNSNSSNSGINSNANSNSNKPTTSITIPSKKASISIEIRRDAEKSSAVKTYKSQFRSHGLTEEAPPPPSRKTLKKPGASQPGTVIPTSLPSSLKRPSPPPKDLQTEKKQKIDINSITPAAATAAEKPGAIKLIPPKRIQTLVETNLFSDALAAATGPKKIVKRKRPAATVNGKDDATTPTSPDAAKVAPLKFYQDTLDESAKSSVSDEKSTDKTKTATETTNSSNDETTENADKEKDANSENDDDDDIPLKKVKEDIDKRVLKEKAADAVIVGNSIDITSDAEADAKTDSVGDQSPIVEEARKPGPGCGPNGPPGVLLFHRRKGPKKKLTWRPQETLEQVRYFEMDENERVNVMKVSFSDMKNLERFNERTSLSNLTKRGPRPGDTQEPRTEWRPLIEVDDVPVHPDGAQSRERKVQADREMTTLRALYFSPNMIPDSPSEAELELHSTVDPPAIPLDDITGNPDGINDFSNMPWPEPKGSPRNNDSGTGGLGLSNAAADMFGALNAATLPPKSNNVVPPASNPFSNFMHPFSGGVGGAAAPNNMPPINQQMQTPPNNWQGPLPPPPPPMQNGPMMPNPFQNHPNPEIMLNGGPPGPNFIGPQRGPVFNGPPFMQPGNSSYGPPPPPNFVPNGPNFGPMVGPGGVPPLMSNNIGPMMNGPRGNNVNMGNNRNNPSWVHGSHNNFPEKNWRPAGTGGNNNNGVCKAFMRGNCRSGSNCKYIHPKSRR